MKRPLAYADSVPLGFARLILGVMKNTVKIRMASLLSRATEDRFIDIGVALTYTCY